MSEQPPRQEPPLVPLNYAGRPMGESYQGLAIAALVLSLILPPLGLILARQALNEMRISGNPAGRGLAQVGLVLGIIGTVILGLLVCVFVVCLVVVSTIR